MELKRKMVNWLYNKLVIPTITYVSLVWWHKAKNEVAVHKLSKLQRLACLGITKAFTTTATAAMKVLLGLPLLHLEVEAQAGIVAGRLKIGSGKTTWLAGGCTTKLLEVEEENCFVSMQSDRIRIVFDFGSG